MDKKRFPSALGAGALVLSLVFFFPPGASAQGAPIAVTVNGNQISLSPEPIDQGGRIFVPLRGVFENLGASVVYSDGTINATGNGHNVSLQIGSTQANVDGQVQTLAVAPFIIGGSTYVPLRFVSEALGATVNWDDASSTVDIELAGASAPQDQEQSQPANYDYASYAPPPIPAYDQPYVPVPNYVWQPGYWAWGAYGYFWVPGTWVAAPQPGYYWTPGYWGYSGSRYAWNQGYWAPSVGYYGGVNYGYGYYGNGYNGGRWSHNTFTYNTYVTRVNTTIVRNTYIQKTTYVNTETRPRPSYNGPGGVTTRPTEQQLQIARGPRLAPTNVQQAHVRTAGQDRALLAKVNHNAPPVLAVAQPLNTAHRPSGFVPVKPSDKVAPPAYHPAPARPAEPARPAAPVRPAEPAVRPAPVEHPPVAKPPADKPPATERTAPAYRPPAPERTAPVNRPAETAAPAERPAPVDRPPATERPAPVDRPPATERPAPVNRPAEPAAPAERPAPVHTVPAYHPPAQQPAHPAQPPARPPQQPAQPARPPQQPAQPARPPQQPARPPAPANHPQPSPANHPQPPPATHPQPHPKPTDEPKQP